MKKTLLSIVFLTSLLVIGIPYLIGVVAEQQFTNHNPGFYQKANLELVDSTYQRGWFSSVARSTFEMLGISKPASKNSLFTLVHKIEHGILLVQSTSIHTTLHIASDLKAKLVKEFNRDALLDVFTTIQVNGDSVSTLTIPAQEFVSGDFYLRWQDLQGQLHVKQNIAQVDLYTPQIQLDTLMGQMLSQNVKLNLEVQLNAGSIQGFGDLKIKSLQMEGETMLPVKLEKFSLVGNSDIVERNLVVAGEAKSQQVHVGKDSYGPASSNFELHNWDIPTLNNIKNTLVEVWKQKLPPAQTNRTLMFRLVPYGFELLKSKPELAIKHLNITMPNGELNGKLQVKMQPFSGNLFTTLFDPTTLAKIVDGQLEMHVSQSLVDDSTQETGIQQVIGQQLNIWRNKGILVAAGSRYYRSQIRLQDGFLWVNDKQIPITTLWR